MTTMGKEASLDGLGNEREIKKAGMHELILK